jgi:protein-tyrosine phosphatase
MRSRSLLGQQVPGSINLRDFGGYPTLDGGFVRAGALFRSGTTHELAPAGVSQLVQQVGIRSVVDLRSDSERSRGLTDFAAYGIVTMHEPLAAGLAGNPTAPRYDWIRRMARGELDWVETFWRILHLNSERFVEIVSHVSRAESLPVLIHCTSGRDRTGLTVALLQAALGVAPDDIASEYALSDVLRDAEGGPRSHLEQVFVDAEVPPEQVQRALSTRPETMRRLFARMDEEYGGAEAMLRTFGLAWEVLERLRSTLVVRAAT